MSGIARLSVILTLVGLAGCSCPDTFDHLTIAAVSTGPVYHSSTTPKWEGAYQHPVDQTFQATATWGPADPVPQADAFELYVVTSGDPEALDFPSSACTTDVPAEDRQGACEHFGDGGSCPFEGRTWESVDQLEMGESYMMVFYPGRGNGKELSWDGERVEFNGEQALTMDIVVTEPIE